MKSNSCLDAALRELDEAGVRDVTKSNGGKHTQIHWRVNGREPRFFTIPCTPSDSRSHLNVRAAIRRMLREDGVIEITKSAAPMRAPSRIERLERRVVELENKLALLMGGRP